MTANLSSSVYLNGMKESYMINEIVCIATSQTHWMAEEKRAVTKFLQRIDTRLF